MSFSLSLLPSTSSTDASTSLLTILYGGGTSSATTTNPITALQQAVKNETKGVAAAAAEPQAKREITAFRAAVAKAKDAKSLLADPVARKVLLTANGLGDQTDFAGLATKALLSDTTKAGSLASQLTDTRWLDTAKTFDFANKGLSVLKQPKVLDSIANGYAEVAWRKSLDATTPGLSNALDFRERASGITSADQILGDSTLREVVTTALGIPKEIAYQTLQAQEKAITSRLDISKLKDANFVEQFTRRYLIAAGSSSTSGSSSSGLLV